MNCWYFAGVGVQLPCVCSVLVHSCFRNVGLHIYEWATFWIKFGLLRYLIVFRCFSCFCKTSGRRQSHDNIQLLNPFLFTTFNFSRASLGRIHATSTGFQSRKLGQRCATLSVSGGSRFRFQDSDNHLLIFEQSGFLCAFINLHCHIFGQI